MPDRPTMSELAAAAGGSPSLTCPACKAELFKAVSTWWVLGVNGARQKRRARVCRACGYTDNETVPAPIRDADQPFPGHSASTGNSEQDAIE